MKDDQSFTNDNGVLNTPCKNVLIVHAQPEPTSFTHYLVDIARETLEANGHHVIESDLYKMNWKAVFDQDDFPDRINIDRFSYTSESAHAYASSSQPSDIENEQDKLKAADAVIFAFPLWWYGMPAIMKGWMDRVWTNGLAYGFKRGGIIRRYGDGGFSGKRALLAVSIGGVAEEFGPRGICGPIDQLLFPITHGCLFYTGMQVLSNFTVFSTHHLSEERVSRIAGEWKYRLNMLFEEKPIQYRAQDSGDYSNKWVLDDHVASGITGFDAHIR